ncbi:hypothetical protein GCM10009535_39550 [Streptomyces thermocarboxydovorans]|uniref:Secreted protein n=1 Tax=Streptomyces thermocarboxydovorans TaxID=59298 RepID=A0ABN1HKF2_9ACTN
MEAVFAVVVLLFVLLMVLGAYATVKVVGAAKRSADRHITQARRTVEDHTLKVKSLVAPGAAGEVAQLRLKLRTSMRATQDTLQAAAAEDESIKESLALFERLSAHGHELDAELRRLEGEPDRATLAERLPGLRERTERITQSADSLRWAARDRARRFAEDDLESLSTQIGMEAGALRHWTTEEPPAGGQPAGGQTASGSGQVASGSGTGRSAAGSRPAAAPWPEAPAQSPTAGQTWPEEPAKAQEPEPERQRPAIAPSAPRPTYPWEKKRRPESTT